MITGKTNSVLLKQYRREYGKIAPNVKRAIETLEPGETIRIRREFNIPAKPHVCGFETVGHPKPGVRRVRIYEIVYRYGPFPPGQREKRFKSIH